jgi:hypothetical protein
VSSAAIAPEDQELIAEHLAQFVHDPLGAVLYGFDWDEGDLSGIQGPRKWQREVFEYIGQHLSNPETRHQPCRVAISSGHGPGKSALASLLTWWGMSTFPDCRVNCTANTKGQLDTKTQPEMSRWFKRSRNASWWDVHVTSIKHNEVKGEAGWRADFVPWSEDNAQAVAGLHNARKRLILIFDEASEIADIIRDTAQGALTDSDTEIIWLALGNPTRNVGWFYDAVFGHQKHRWKTWVIDSRDVEGTNKAEIAEWLEECDGNEDADYFRVRARGLPPRAGSGQFIDLDRIAKAQQRKPRFLSDDPLIAGVDFAWGGEDDNVVRFRKGLDARSIPPIKVKGEFTRDPAVMTQKLGEVLTRQYNGQRIVMMFMDSAGIAGPVAARLRALGHKNIMEVNFGADSPDAKCAYFRDFIWTKMRDWLLEGAIDKDPGLEADLSGPMLVSDKMQRIKLESKELMKKRLKKLGKAGDSPDDGDALALTFSAPVLPPKKKEHKPSRAASSPWS